MSQPKIPEDLRDYLRELNLTVWLCVHPLTYDYEWTGTGPKRGRADKTRVHVQLAGPALIDFAPWGYGENVREAVADVLRNSYVRARFPGLVGAIARLEQAIESLRIEVICARDPDDVPF